MQVPSSFGAGLSSSPYRSSAPGLSCSCLPRFCAQGTASASDAHTESLLISLTAVIPNIPLPPALPPSMRQPRQQPRPLRRARRLRVESLEQRLALAADVTTG